MEILYKDNGNLVALGNPDTGLGGLKNVATDSYVNDATVTLTGIKDAAGAYVTGTTDLSMTYLGSSNGIYQVSVPDTVALTLGARYTIVIDASGGGEDAHFEIPAICRLRTA